jgi:hypothetical protein
MSEASAGVPAPAGGPLRSALGRLASALGALVAVYALNPFVRAHKLDDRFHPVGPDAYARLAPGEALFVLGWLVAGGLAVALVARALGPAVGERVHALLARRALPLLAAGLAVLLVGALGVAFAHGPVAPEQTGCDLLARTMARGRVTVAALPASPALDHPFVAQAGGRRFGVCAPGQAALLLGARALGRAGFLVFGLAAAAVVLWAGQLARELSGDAASAGLAALMAAVSPALVCAGASAGAGLPAALVCLALARFALAFARRGRLLDAAAMGGGGGLGLLVAPLETAVTALALAAVGLAAGDRDRLRARAHGLGVALAVALPFALALGAFHRATTGRVLVSPLTYLVHQRGGLRFGFGPAPFGLPAHTLWAAVGELAVALTRLDGWLLAWPLGLLALAAAVFARGPRRQAVTLAPLGGFAVVVLLSTSGGGWAVGGPAALLPAVPLFLVAIACGLEPLRARLGGWPLTVALAATLVGAGTFWRVEVLRETAPVARRNVDPVAAAARQHIVTGAVLYPPTMIDAAPAPLGLGDPLLFLPTGDGTLAIELLPDRRLYRYGVLPSGAGELFPLF